MSTSVTEPRRSWLMWLMRLTPAPIFSAFIAGVVLMVVGRSAGAGARGPAFFDAGSYLLALDGLLFVVVLWGGVYLEVVDASRGHPGLRSVGEPTMTPEVTAELRAREQSLSALGFRHDGWFVLDDFAETHVSAWRHDARPAVAFLLYFPGAEAFRLRFVRRFPSGGVLVSSTRLTDLAYPPPQGVYVQVQKGASVEALWAWHLEAEALFPDAIDSAPGSAAAGGPKDLYVEVSARWAGHRRRDRTWLLAVEPVEECWRLYHLCGVPLRRQFERGWTTPYWQ